MGDEMFPTPWVYDEDNRWVTRATDPEGGEIAMEFAPDGVPDEDVLFSILALLNGELSTAAASIARWEDSEAEDDGDNGESEAWGGEEDGW